MTKHALDFNDEFPGFTNKELEIERELEWLRFFYTTAGDAMGSADSEIYEMIKQSYIDGGRILPTEYALSERDYDEDEELEE